MMRATVPPSASMPSESGVTSSSSISSVACEAPARMSACTAAPSATTSSGFNSVCGFLPRALSRKRSSTRARTAGILRRSADQNHFVDLLRRDAGVGHGLLARTHGSGEDRLDQQLEDRARNLALIAVAVGQFDSRSCAEGSVESRTLASMAALRSACTAPGCSRRSTPCSA